MHCLKTKPNTKCSASHNISFTKKILWKNQKENTFLYPFQATNSTTLLLFILVSSLDSLTA